MPACTSGARHTRSIIPHDSALLEDQGGYRFIPMKTVYGESSDAPFSLSS